MIQKLFIRGDHTLIHGISHFADQFGIGDQRTNGIHFQHGRPLLLREIVLTMGFVEFVVSFHHALHQPNQIPEDLHTADTVKVLRRNILVFQRVTDFMSQCIDLRIGIDLIGCNTGQKITTHLCPGIDDGLQILLQGIIAADQLANGDSNGNGTMAIAEIPVIIHLESGTHGMVFDGK